MYASEYFFEISELLRRLPREIVLLLKTNDCLRAVNNSLVSIPLLELGPISGSDQGWIGCVPNWDLIKKISPFNIRIIEFHKLYQIQIKDQNLTRL